MEKDRERERRIKKGGRREKNVGEDRDRCSG